MSDGYDKHMEMGAIDRSMRASYECDEVWQAIKDKLPAGHDAQGYLIAELERQIKRRIELEDLQRKVYIAQGGSFRDPYVFSTRDKAIAFIGRYPEMFGSEDVDQYLTEVELDPMGV